MRESSRGKREGLDGPLRQRCRVCAPAGEFLLRDEQESTRPEEPRQPREQVPVLHDAQVDVPAVDLFSRGQIDTFAKSRKEEGKGRKERTTSKELAGQGRSVFMSKSSKLQLEGTKELLVGRSR